MRRQPADDYKKLTPLKRIAEASSYSLGYVSILVQRKKLKAKKIGNKYYSTKEWFDQYLELHARDEKRLSSEVAQELLNNPPNPLYQGGATQGGTKNVSQAQASANLKTRIDNLVDRAIKEKLDAQAISPEAARPFYQVDKILSELDTLAVRPEAGPAAISTSPEIALELKTDATLKPVELISSIEAEPIIIKAAHEFEPAFFVAEKESAAAPVISFNQAAILAAEPKNLKNILEEKFAAEPKENSVEPEIKFEAVWRQSFARQKKDLFKRQRVYKINGQAARQAGAGLAKIFIARPLVLKTSAAALTVVLIASALTFFAPAVSSALSRGAKQAISRTAIQVKWLAASGAKYVNQTGVTLQPAKEFLARTKTEVVIPGSSLAGEAKTAFDNTLINLAGRVGAFSLRLEKTAQSGREYVAVKLAGIRKLQELKNQTLAKAQAWRGKLISQIARLGKEKNQPANLPARLAEAPAKRAGQAGGAAETLSATSTLARLLNLANQASLKTKDTGRVLGISEGEAEVFRSENYQIKQMNFGGEMIFLSDENIAAPLTITEIRSESATDLKGEINKLLVFWNTNKLATTELSYFRAGENQAAAKKIKDNNFSFSHSAALSDLDKSTVYNFVIKAADRWGNEASSNRFAAYSGAKPISIFQLIVNTLEDSFNWAIKEEKIQNP